MPHYPDDDKLYIKVCRFINVLDDDMNRFSPVKFNAWAANLAVFSAGIATIIGFLGQHLSEVASLWGPIGGWLTQAHATNHFDKRERNLQQVRVEEASK